MHVVRLLWATAAVLVAARHCDVGSRSDCSDHGVCAHHSSFESDFFNECKCDMCWTSFECDMNLCLFFAIPFGIFLVCAVVLCCCGFAQQMFVGAAVGVGAVGMARSIENSQFYRGQRGRVPPLVTAGVAPQPGFMAAQAGYPTPVYQQPCTVQPAMEMSGAAVFMCECPHGVHAGQQVQVQTPKGVMMMVTVPAGVLPGQQFQVYY